MSDSDETLDDATPADSPDVTEATEPEAAEAASEEAAIDDADEAPAGATADGEAKAKAKDDRKAKADAAVAERQVVARRTVTSRRVTPKGGPAAAAKKKGADAAPASASKARDAKKTASVVTKAPPVTPQQVYAKGPSPWYVPAIMFGLLIVGALIIMSNYMGVFGDASNIRLVIGLGFILGGIVTATQYR
jgi:hypothetical protein